MGKTLGLIVLLLVGFTGLAGIGLAGNRMYRAVTVPAFECRKMPILDGELIRVKQGGFTFERNRIGDQVNLERLIDGRNGTGCKPEFWVTGNTLIDGRCGPTGKLERYPYKGSRDDLPDNVAADFNRLSALAEKCDKTNADR